MLMRKILQKTRDVSIMVIHVHLVCLHRKNRTRFSISSSALDCKKHVLYERPLGVLKSPFSTKSDDAQTRTVSTGKTALSQRNRLCNSHNNLLVLN